MNKQFKLARNMFQKLQRLPVYLLLAQKTGSGLVEYAIIFFLFMTMLFGIADFGRALYADHYISNAVRDASRWAAVNGSTCTSDSSCASPAQPTDIENHVTQNVAPGIDPSKLTVTASWSTTPNCTTASNTPGCGVDVHAQYQFNFFFPFVSNQTLTLTSESQSVIVH
jgi:Flp pilus assembly protein TadG